MARRVSNPPNPWLSRHVEDLGEAPTAELEVHEERARSIVASNDSPDIGFRYSVNPYRGCFHACAYCYARPTHQYLGWGAGTDFDRKIVVKLNAAELLRAKLMSKSWKGDTLVFSGVTDCYQPLEASYGLTRACLEVCRDFRNPVGLVTKGALVRRDKDLLAEMGASVTISLAFADDKTSGLIEPSASPPSRRLQALRELTEAGVRVGLIFAPVIPGLNDSHAPEVLQRAKDAGASWAACTLLRLPAEVESVFRERVQEAFPLRAKKILHGLVDFRGGKLKDSRFGKRMVGEGPRWETWEQMFEAQCRKIGLGTRWPEERSTPFRRPSDQGTLFGEA